VFYCFSSGKEDKKILKIRIQYHKLKRIEQNPKKPRFHRADQLKQFKIKNSQLKIANSYN